MRRAVILLTAAALILGATVAYAAGGAGDDVQRYNAMASGSIDFATHSASVLILDVGMGRWEVRDVSLGADHITATKDGYVRVACWFDDSAQHPFASFRIYVDAAGSVPFAPSAQQPRWFAALDPGQVWCGAEEIGAQLTGGEMWFRLSYRSH